MTCKIVNTGSFTAIVCARGARPIKCAFRGTKGDLLCDWPVGKGTCGKPLCGECAVQGPASDDYCPDHKEAGAT